MLKVDNLFFARGKLLLSNISMSLGPGELLHVLGENGSGKTTLMRILSGLLFAERAEIYWNERKVDNHNAEYKSELLYIGHLNGLKDDLTAFENLSIGVQVKGNNQYDTEIKSALEAVGVKHSLNTKVGFLSQGQKRRVALANIWLANSKLWILDEPFVSLDAVSIQSVLNQIVKHLQKGGMVILTSHQDVNHTLIEPKILRLTS